MNIQNLVMPTILSPKPSRRKKDKEEKIMSKTDMPSAAKALSNQGQKYDVMNGIGQTNAGISIGQIVWGDLMEVIKIDKRLLDGKGVKTMVAAIDE